MTYEQTLARVVELREAIRVLQAEERTLREGIFNGTFPDPKEGVNTYRLPSGIVVKGTYKLNRKINDEKYISEWSRICKEGKIPPPVAMSLIKRKYDLSLKPYRDLEPEQQKLVDTILEIKPGLPDLEVIPPKEVG